MTRFLIVGPPGAGKGTQSARLTDTFGIPAIATGDIFRANIKNQTELGQQVKAIIDAGDYVPDSLTNDLVAHRLLEEDAVDGFLLDGYPRTLDQLGFLDGVLAKSDTALDAVIQLVVDPNEVVSRLLKRAHEEGRTDDTEDTIRHRQSLYKRETAPLIAVYKDRGLVIEIDALGEVDEVASRIAAALADRGIALPDAATK
ncbi:adenylate kinase [Glaciihabitans arcticus]|uniref:Adenylate kinase n=1 Tax=Glaciihabitans arcticus TaxID=2668039 RepID=A0A4Q9GSZ4_9MICO|nr:adenylate kinase [Glaciihabitans arcticus]TBN57811.1 adenylate kinase [Glaciihabitans arcticus]